MCVFVGIFFGGDNRYKYYVEVNISPSFSLFHKPSHLKKNHHMGLKLHLFNCIMLTLAIVQFQIIHRI